MRILKIDPKRPDAASLKKAGDVLKRGGLVVYPTETAYALGCDPKNAHAVRKIFTIKKRDVSKPLPLIAASKFQAVKFLRPHIFNRMLADAFWPGPLTLVGVAQRRFASGVASKKKEIAVRVSPHLVARALSKALGRPVISTSANLSGHMTPYRIDSVLRDLGTLPDLVLDAGRLEHAKPSTLVRAQGGVIAILREGPISEDDLHRELMKRL